MKNHQLKRRKGFTLIELLVVIGIVVILSAVVILTLNPAQLLRQARDSNRISDLSTLKSALALYLSDVSSPDLDGFTAPYSPINCSVHPSSGMAANTLCSASSRFVAGAGLTYWSTSTAPLAVVGTGWIPVSLASTTGGSPIAALPADPTNNTTYFYGYRPDNVNFTFEINADMESTKYGNGGTSDVESSDGGNRAEFYEVGTDGGLDL